MHVLKTSLVERRQIASLILNAFIVVLEIIGTSMSARAHGWRMFQFYTVDSNILALNACLAYSVYTAASLMSGKAMIPQWVRILKYMATCCLTVTFVVVIFVLAPTSGSNGYKIMLLNGDMLYHHLLCPLLVLASFILLETDPPLHKKYALRATILTLLYAVVVLILNITRFMIGPYPFLHVYSQPVYVAAIFGGAYLAARLILLANRKIGYSEEIGQ